VNDLRDVIRRFVKERNRERSHSPKMKIGRPRVHGAPCVRSSITDTWLGPGFSTAGVVVSNSKERVGAVVLAYQATKTRSGQRRQASALTRMPSPEETRI
jgi:hypothetical protein